MAEEKQSDPWVEALATVKRARELAGALTTPEGAGFSVTVQGEASDALTAACDQLKQSETKLRVARALTFFMDNGPHEGYDEMPPARVF